MVIKGQDDSILPVLIVGAGPVGLTLAFLLTKLGVKCAILEKSKELSRHPQAHYVNNRTMEVFRKMDGLADDLFKSQPPVDQWRNYVYCTSLMGRILGSVDQMGSEEFDENDSPTGVSHFPQHKLVRMMLNKLKVLGFKIKHPETNKDHQNGQIIWDKDILMGSKCISITPTNQGVTVTILIEKEGVCIEKYIDCKYLVAADGARSSIREMVGIKFEGLGNLQSLVGVHFFSRELAKYLANERPAMLYLIINSKAVCLVSYNLADAEFVMQVPYFPPQHTLEDFGSMMGKKLLYELIGRELGDIQIMGVKPWFMHAQVAEKFITGDNRVIIVGDAAHRFPPAGGFGMNTGIQDAHNLAWKMAYVMQGIAPQSFLSTYEVERKQIASFLTTFCIENFTDAMSIHTALGLDLSIAASVHRVINGTMGSILPPALKKAILNWTLSISNVMISEIFLNEKSPFGSSRLAKVNQIFEEGRTLRLRFPAEDLGYKYLRGALVSEGGGDDIWDNAIQLSDRSKKKYVPSTEPGSRLPHMNIRLLSSSSRKATIVSTLDLTLVEKAEFVFIIAPTQDSYKLARTALMVAEGIKIPLKVCVMWPENTTNSSGGSEGVLKPWTNIIDVVEIKNSPSSASWWELCKMETSGAILVRPDDHVAWSSKSGNVKDLELKVKQVFEAILGLN